MQLRMWKPGSGEHSHGHTHHGLVDPSIARSRAGLRAVGLSLLVLALTAMGQALVFAFSQSVALLADLVHNLGDAMTALPLGVAFLLRARRAEQLAGIAVVGAILASAAVAAGEAGLRLVHPREPRHLLALALAGGLGFAGNLIAAEIRSRAGRTLASPALIADGSHARIDALVSLGVVASAAAVATGAAVADPLIGLAIAGLILRVGWQSWRTVRRSPRGKSMAS